MRGQLFHGPSRTSLWGPSAPAVGTGGSRVSPAHHLSTEFDFSPRPAEQVAADFFVDAPLQGWTLRGLKPH